MSISLDSTSSVSGNDSSYSFSHNCSGENRVMVISVSFFPTNGEEVSSITYNTNQSFELISVAQIENSVRTEVWILIDPAVGENDVDISFSGPVEFLIVSASYTGVSQTNTVFNFRSGAGKNVKKLGVKSFSKTDGISIGMGCTNNNNSYVTTLYGPQQEDWNYSASNLRSQAISALGTSDSEDVSIPNSLSSAADYAVVVLGMAGA